MSLAEVSAPRLKGPPSREGGGSRASRRVRGRAQRRRGILGGTTMAAQGAELRQPSCGRRFLASWGLSRAGRPCPWPASERADCLVAHYAGYFLPLLFLTTSARAPEKAPSENAWCFFVTSNSHHVRRRHPKKNSVWKCVVFFLPPFGTVGGSS
jgi:hypothetical protein